MKSLNVKITGLGKFNPIILIDDKEINAKKNKFGSFEHTEITDKESVNIKIKSLLEIESRFWFIYGIFFFIISLFGILDYRLPKKCVKILYEGNVKLSSENGVINIGLLSMPGGPCAEVKTECEVTEVANMCEVDKVGLKRLKILKNTKLVMWILLVGTLIGLLAMSMI